MKKLTIEDKELLFKDLCARVPYKPFAQWHHKALNEFRDVKIMEVSTYGKNIDDYHINVLCQPEPGVDYEASIVDIKLYLRPMSSMTEEEKIIQRSKMRYEGYFVNHVYYHTLEEFDYLNSIHVDYRTDDEGKTMIEKGLALEAPEGMYK